MAKIFLSHITMQDEQPDTKTFVDTLICGSYIKSMVRIWIYVPTTNIMAQEMTVLQ